MFNRKRGLYLLMIAIVLVGLVVAALDLAKKKESAGKTAQPDPFPKYDPAITLTAVRNLNDSTVFLAGESLTNNVWSREYMDTLGIQIKYLWTTTKGTEDYNQRLNASILTGEIPDIFEVDSLQLKQLVTAGLIEDLTDIYKANASAAVRRMLEEIPNALETAEFAGRLMAIPQGASTTDQSQVLWIRYDWLKRLGLPEPETMQDVIMISEAFTKLDPDGNGKPDTYGLGLNMGLHNRINVASLKGFLNGFHAYPASWIKTSDGQIAYGGIQPEVKAALIVLRDMYKDGQLDPEFSVKDQNYMAEEIVAGKVGMQYGAWWNPTYPLQASKAADPDADWRSYGIPSINTEPAKMEYNFPVYSYFVVKKGAKHPEALVHLLNLMVYRGYEEPQWERLFIGKDGFLYNNYPLVYTWPENGSYKNYLHIQEALRSENPNELNTTEKGYYDNILAYREGAEQYWFEEGMYGKISAWAYVKDKLDHQYIQMNEFYGPPTKTMSQVTPILEKLTLDTYTMIIMGELPLEAFDEFVDQWKDLGGDIITKEVNDWVKAKGG